ncbi:hypothetical protein AB1N83_007308 [Pleurotus pulmonarius]
MESGQGAIGCSRPGHLILKRTTISFFPSVTSLNEGVEGLAYLRRLLPSFLTCIRPRLPQPSRLVTSRSFKTARGVFHYLREDVSPSELFGLVECPVRVYGVQEPRYEPHSSCHGHLSTRRHTYLSKALPKAHLLCKACENFGESVWPSVCDAFVTRTLLSPTPRHLLLPPTAVHVSSGFNRFCGSRV